MQVAFLFGKEAYMDAVYSYGYIKVAIVIFLFINLFWPILKKLKRKIQKELRYRQYLDSPLAAIDRMKGDEFEEYLAAHFRKLGYRVSLTPKSNDYGADLIIKKDGESIVVQAKRYRDKVGIKAIQEIIGAKGYYKADKMMVVTNSYFTSAANDVTLWDRNSINQFFKIKKG